MNEMFHGYDMDRTMLRIGAMNMMTHGVDNPFIDREILEKEAEGVLLWILDGLNTLDAQSLQNRRQQPHKGTER